MNLYKNVLIFVYGAMAQRLRRLSGKQEVRGTNPGSGTFVYYQRKLIGFYR